MPRGSPSAFVQQADSTAAPATIRHASTFIRGAAVQSPICFPSYALRNAAGEAARLRKRIAELEARATRPTAPAIELAGARIEEAENRVRIVFDAKPDETVRSALKSAGFRWSPTSGAWQRHASNAAWYEAKRILHADAPGGSVLGVDDGRVPARRHASEDRHNNGKSPMVHQRRDYTM